MPANRLRVLTCSALGAALLAAAGVLAGAQTPAPGTTPSSFTLTQVLGFPFSAELVAAPGGARFGWTTFQRGVRTIWVADGPAFAPRALVTYAADDGLELSNLAFSGDSRRLVYVRGGDHGANWAAEGGLAPNPASSPIQPKMQVWSVDAGGGTPVLLGEGPRDMGRPRRRQQAGAADVLCARHQRVARVVARRHRPRLCVQPRRFRLHRPLHVRRSADPLHGAGHLPRQHAPLVSRWRAHRLRAQAGARRAGSSTARAGSLAVGDLGRGRCHGNGRAGMAGPGHGLGLVSAHRGRRQPLLGRTWTAGRTCIRCRPAEARRCASRRAGSWSSLSA
jgi:hypothetical protein